MGLSVGVIVAILAGAVVVVGKGVAVKMVFGRITGVSAESWIFGTGTTCATGAQALLSSRTMRKRIVMLFMGIPLDDGVSCCFNGSSYSLVPANADGWRIICVERRFE